MANNLYTTKTAALKATKADINKLDAKKIYLGGENILDLINNNNNTSATTNIKHANDTRETVTENDIWGPWIETMSDGTIIVHDDEVINPNASSSSAWNTSITKVEDNKAYIGDEFYANIQTENIEDGSCMFRGCNNFTSVDAGDMNLHNLTNGYCMFDGCTNMTSFYCELPSLTIGHCMFSGCTNLKSFNYGTYNLKDGRSMFHNCVNLTSFFSDLSSLTNGNGMFEGCTKLATFNPSMPSLTNGSSMFRNCSQLKSISLDLSSLTDGIQMFEYCNNLKSFISDLPSLTNGYSMFAYSNLSSFSSDLSSLTCGYFMFHRCSNLATFSSDLPSLTYGYGTFDKCTKLKSFSSDLSSLINGEWMFPNCTNLTSFNSNLSSLTYGRDMFYMCKLDAASVMYIADSIKDITAEKQLYTNGTIPYVTVDTSSYPNVYSATKGFMSNGNYVYTYDQAYRHTETISASNVGKLTLGINVTNNSSTIQQQLEDFAKAATFDSWANLKQIFVDKGWKVTFQYGGTYDSITYDLRDGEQIIPCQIFAKLIEIEPQGVEYDEDGSVLRENFYTDEQMNSATYCNEDASTFYIIEWGHDVTDTSSYTQFNSLEDAMTSWNVFPKENIITTEE